MTEFPIERRDLLRVTGAGLLGTAGTGDAQTTGTQETSGGDLVWEFTQPSSDVFSSPTVADDTVYVGSNDSNLYAVDAATGSQEWVFETSRFVFSSPTIVDGTVYVGSHDSNLYAVDAATGSQEWVFETSGFVFSSPTIVDGTVYVGSNDSNLYAVDAATGDQEWAFTQPSDTVQSSPTVADDTVYVGSADDTLYAVAADSGSQEWAFTQPSDSVSSSPTVADGTVYVGSRDETLYAVDADSGSQEWTFTQPFDRVDSSPTVADGTVYVGSADATLYAVDADSGSKEWSFGQSSGGVFSSPTVADGTVYVGAFWSDDFLAGTLYALDADSGSQEWEFNQPSGDVVSSPTVADGTVYVGSHDNTLYAVDAGVEGSSEGSRVRLRTLGHHDENIGQPPGGGETDEVWSQQQKLTASDGDGESGDNFGVSVGLSDDGTTALIGASGDDDRARSAYVFSRSEGAWSQQQKLTASDGESRDAFGDSVAMSDDGTTALIGASGDDDRAGSAYVFSRSEGAWSQQQKLTASDGESGDRFGFSVGLSNDGTTALIGAANDDNPNGEDAVSAYVFSRSEGAWSQQQKLTASDGDVDDVFGSSVGLSDDGTTALIAAPRLLRNENNGHAGSAYVFSRSEGAWSQQQKLTASDGERDFFGVSVGLSDDGTTALIGATDGESPNGRLTGSAYVFSRSGGAWSQQQKLTASDGERIDIFGSSVGLSDDGTTALIGAEGDDDSTGSAYVFSRSEGAWSQQQKLTASDGDGESGDNFGASVGLSDDGTTALIGADEDDDDTGSAYVFIKNGSTPPRGEPSWTLTAQAFQPVDGPGPLPAQPGETFRLSLVITNTGTVPSDASVEFKAASSGEHNADYYGDQFAVESHTDDGGEWFVEGWRWDENTDSGPIAPDETREPVVELAVAEDVSAGEYTFAMSGPDGAMATATVTVAPLDGTRQQKLALAGRIDDAATFDSLLTREPSTLAFQPEQEVARNSLDLLEESVPDGSLSRETAIDAANRLIWGEQLTEDVLQYTGDATITTDVTELPDDLNIAQQTAGPLLRVVVSLLLQAQAASKIVSSISQKLPGAVSINPDQIEGVANKLLDIALGFKSETDDVPADAPDTTDPTTLLEDLQPEVATIVEEIENGVTTSVDAVLSTIDAVVQPFIDVAAGTLRVFLEHIALSGTVTEGVDAGLSGAVTNLHSALRPEAIASGGLAGSQSQAEEAYTEGGAGLIQTAVEAADVLDGFGTQEKLRDSTELAVNVLKLEPEEIDVTTIVEFAREALGLTPGIYGEALDLGLGIGFMLNLHASHSNAHTGIINGEV